MLPGVRRPVVVLLFLAIFAGEIMWHAIVPLIPAFSQRFHLSKLEGGVLLSSTSVAILLVSIPAGMLSERFGVRRLTLAGMVVIALADLGQGVAALLSSTARRASAVRARLRHPLDVRSRVAERGVG